MPKLPGINHQQAVRALENRPYRTDDERMSYGSIISRRSER